MAACNRLSAGDEVLTVRGLHEEEQTSPGAQIYFCETHGGALGLHLHPACSGCHTLC